MVTRWRTREYRCSVLPSREKVQCGCQDRRRPRTSRIQVDASNICALLARRIHGHWRLTLIGCHERCSATLPIIRGGLSSQRLPLPRYFPPRPKASHLPVAESSRDDKSRWCKDAVRQQTRSDHLYSVQF
jgi:hypothetical protein